MGMQFHETVYGKRFFEQQLPALTKALNRVADVYEKKQNAAEYTVFVSYHMNLAPLNKPKGTLSNMDVRLCNTADVLDWVKELVDKLRSEGYATDTEERLKAFYSNLPFEHRSILQLSKDTNEDDTFYLVVEKFYVKLEDKR